jgi:magnesium transporter
VKAKWYLLSSGKLLEQSSPIEWTQKDAIVPSERWMDVVDATTDELRLFLKDLDLHPTQLARCLDSIDNPGAISFENAVLVEYPTAFDVGSDDPNFLTIIIKGTTLVTIRHGLTPSLDDLVQELTATDAAPLRHLPQIVYLILDQFSDLNVEAQIDIREQILHTSKKLAEDPNSINANALSLLRLQVDKLVALIENQLYCVSGLSASDNITLQEPHRKAFIQDLVSEAEIAQRGVYRLENRVNDLYSDYQMVGNDRVEKRLRFLTIVSAITLPLGLIAGLLGMNVGGLPGLSFRYGFLAVIILMMVIGAIQYWYFKRNGWFD